MANKTNKKKENKMENTFNEKYDKILKTVKAAKSGLTPIQIANTINKAEGYCCIRATEVNLIAPQIKEIYCHCNTWYTRG